MTDIIINKFQAVLQAADEARQVGKVAFEAKLTAAIAAGHERCLRLWRQELQTNSSHRSEVRRDLRGLIGGMA